MPETFDNYMNRQRRNASLTDPGLFPEEYQVEEGREPWGGEAENRQRGIDRRVDRGNDTADWLNWLYNSPGDPQDKLKRIPSADDWKYASTYDRNWKSHDRGLERPILDPIDLPVMLLSGGAPAFARTAVGKNLLSKSSRVLAPRADATTGVVGALNRFAKHPATKWAQNAPKMAGGEIGARIGARPAGELIGKYTPLAVAGWGGYEWLKPAQAAISKMKGSPEGAYWEEYGEVVSGDPNMVEEGLAALDKKYDTSKFSEDSQKRIRKAHDFFDRRQPRMTPVSLPPINQVETPPPLPLPVQQQAGGFNPYGPPGRV